MKVGVEGVGGGGERGERVLLCACDQGRANAAPTVGIVGAPMRELWRKNN